jgi:hypothetical protein
MSDNPLTDQIRELIQATLRDYAEARPRDKTHLAQAMKSLYETLKLEEMTASSDWQKFILEAIRDSKKPRKDQ